MSSYPFTAYIGTHDEAPILRLDQRDVTWRWSLVRSSYTERAVGNGLTDVAFSVLSNRIGKDGASARDYIRALRSAMVRFREWKADTTLEQSVWWYFHDDDEHGGARWVIDSAEVTQIANEVTNRFGDGTHVEATVRLTVRGEERITPVVREKAVLRNGFTWPLALDETLEARIAALHISNVTDTYSVGMARHIWVGIKDVRPEFGETVDNTTFMTWWRGTSGPDPSPVVDSDAISGSAFEVDGNGTISARLASQTDSNDVTLDATTALYTLGTFRLLMRYRFSSGTGFFGSLTPFAGIQENGENGQSTLETIYINGTAHPLINVGQSDENYRLVDCGTFSLPSYPLRAHSISSDVDLWTRLQQFAVGCHVVRDSGFASIFIDGFYLLPEARRVYLNGQEWGSNSAVYFDSLVSLNRAEDNNEYAAFITAGGLVDLATPEIGGGGVNLLGRHGGVMTVIGADRDYRHDLSREFSIEATLYGRLD